MLVSSASAAPPKLLKRIGDQPGPAAGQIGQPAGIDTNPTTGHIYVADSNNARIDEFTPWGEFVKAFGWDVAPGAVDEEQEVRVRATAGQFKLSFGSSTTTDLPFDASATEVEAAINELDSIGGGGGSVDVSGGPGGIPGTTPSVYVVIFAGAMAGTDVVQMSAASGTVPLGGGKPSSSLIVRTRADGTAGGSGLESCTSASGCRAGFKGSGAGAFEAARGLAVDSTGAVYVFDRSNQRVQKFDSAGRFLLMFGGEVNKSNGEDICTQADLDDGDECGIGTVGTGNGQFGIENVSGVSGDYIDISPTGDIYIGDKDRIQKFSPEGSYVSEISFAKVHEGASAFPASGNPGALAVDPGSGDIYFAFAFVQDTQAELERRHGTFRVSPDGKLLDTLIGGGPGTEFDGPKVLATDNVGNLYVADEPIINGFGQIDQIVAFDPNGDVLIGYAESFNRVQSIHGLATNSVGDLLVSNFNFSKFSYLAVYGPAPVALEPPPKAAPAIEAQYAVSVDSQGATLRAQINPRFWADTTYYVQYGVADCASNPCAEQPVAPGATLTSDVTDSVVTSAGVFLDGLKAGTTYHYRFVAESSGGGPTVGVDRTFTTPLPPAPNRTCPNQAFRNGASTELPDCRAYEMVSPVDKNNGDIVASFSNLNQRAALNQSAGGGGKLTYSSVTAFGQVKSAPYTSQYMARRGPGGWTTSAISPPREGDSLAGFADQQDTQYKAFSSDLSSGWLVHDSEPRLAPGAIVGQPNLYRRDNDEESYETLSTAKAPHKRFFPGLQGVSKDGRHAIFIAEDNLTANAPDLGSQTQLYEALDGDVRLVSVLPNGTASKVASTAGTRSPNAGSGHDSNVSHAISDDGSRIFWTQKPTGPGPLYVRIDGEETVAISAAPAVFWTASADGSEVVYTVGAGADMYQFDVDAEVATLIAGEVEGVLGASEDASRIYFVSNEALAPGAVGGERNLYLDDKGTIRFVAILAEGDTDSLNFATGVTNPVPTDRVSRVSPDGGHLAFMSNARLTGYDNTDVQSGEIDAQVYLYDADAGGGAGRLVCASCNPSGARPSGREVLTEVGNKTGRWAAAQIPSWHNQLYASRALADDGERLFFESYDALTPRDGNGRRDVYQWEAPGSGDCEEGSAAFSKANEGCVSLISSGESPSDSGFVDASSDGASAFFATSASLLAQDPGLIDIYAARVEGGFPPPPSAAPACEGEACQGPLTPPNDPTPASSAFDGPGNVKERDASRPRCAKGKTRRKGRCVAKKKRRDQQRHAKQDHAKRTSQKGRAGR